MVRTLTSAAAAHATAVAEAPRTYGGGFGSTGSTPEAALRRLVGANLLWENQYYKDGESTARDLYDAASKVDPDVVARLAREAASDWKLRHVPLYLTAALASRGVAFGRAATLPYPTRSLVPAAVTRADSMPELLAIYAKLNDLDVGKLKGKIPMGLKRGLADTFGRFDEYQLAKYDRAQAIRLRDVLFLTHPKPRDDEQAALWKRLVVGKMATPDTWEVGLSGGKGKKETWERLLRERKLGDLAFLRNLRNMEQAGVDRALIDDALANKKFARTLPFQFLAAAQYAPSFERGLDAAMMRAVAQEPRLAGSTLIVVDVSGSMHGTMGGESKLDRLDAAAGLAILLAGQSERPTIYATAGTDGVCVHKTARIPDRSGMALRDAIRASINQLGGGGIFFTQALQYIRAQPSGETVYDRVVVITDEQDTDKDSERAPDRAPRLGQHNYVFNVGAYDVGLKTKSYWDVVTGFSEAAVRYCAFAEAAPQQ